MTKAKPRPRSADDVLYEMQQLNLEIGQTTEQQDYNVKVALFLNLFEDLDKMLTGGGNFPQRWVTKLNQVQLKSHQRSTIEVPRNDPEYPDGKTFTPQPNNFSSHDDEDTETDDFTVHAKATSLPDVHPDQLSQAGY